LYLRVFIVPEGIISNMIVLVSSENENNQNDGQYSPSMSEKIMFKRIKLMIFLSIVRNLPESRGNTLSYV